MPVILNQLLLPELREAIEAEDMASLASFCEILHPSIVAEMLHDLEDPDVYPRVFKHVEAANRASLFEYLPLDTQDSLARSLPVDDMAKLLEHMSSDERVDLVQGARGQGEAGQVERAHGHAERLGPARVGLDPCWAPDAAGDQR